MDVYSEIKNERERQEKKHGADNDDNYTYLDWLTLISRHLLRISGLNYRTQLVRVAALAIAAIESYDRKNKGV